VTRCLGLTSVVVVAILTIASCGGDDTGSPVQDGGGTDTGTGECGNDRAEGSELCDGRDLRGMTCSSATQGVMTGGELSCNSDCTFNVENCIGDGGFEDDGGMGGTGG
jgi:hypothetical protein